MNTNQLMTRQCIGSFRKVWKTIKLGTGINTGHGFRKAIKDSGMRIGWANKILLKSDFIVTYKLTEVNLVVVSVKDLGFDNGATLRDIYRTADERGLDRCPQEVGPQLRLQYSDQPIGEWLCIGMNPITDSTGCFQLFRVGHGDYGQWLTSFESFPGELCRSDVQFVFVLPNI